MLARAQDEMADPERTCAGCRNRDSQGALLRFAVIDHEPRLVPDPRRRLPGRGVSVHPTRACIRRALERGGFARVIGAKPSIEFRALCALVVSQYERRLESLLLSARRKGALTLGTEAVRRALGGGNVALLVLARDAAGRREELMAQAEAVGVNNVSYGTKTELGRLTGRAELGALAVLDAGIAEEVAALAARAAELSEAE